MTPIYSHHHVIPSKCALIFYLWRVRVQSFPRMGGGVGSGGGRVSECGRGRVARLGAIVLHQHTGAKSVHLTDSQIYAIVYLRLGEEANRERYAIVL